MASNSSRESDSSIQGTIRLMLSGASDMHSLIATINEGAIYKFLEKPVSARPFRQALRDAFMTQNPILTYGIVTYNVCLVVHILRFIYLNNL